MEKGIWKQTRTYVLELVQELDKVEGIERLRISSLSQFIEKRNDRICFEKQDFVPHFHIPLQSEVMRFEINEASLPTRNIY
jgi:threonylcarbamoyladenosine tRNA methylthiotransferase MtaB